MHAISKTNHLQYGFTDDFKDDQPHALFCLGIGRISEEINLFAKECELAALDIYAKAQGKNIYVALTGGVDSECALRSFINAKVPVQAAILKFKNDLNWHDVDPAIQLCKHLNISYQIVDLDIFSFFEQGIHLEYAKNFNLASPMFAAQVWLAKEIAQKLNGVPVIAGDFVKLTKPRTRIPFNDDDVKSTNLIQAPSEWNFGSLTTQDHYVVDRSLQANGHFGVGHFYLYSAEQIAASIQLSLTRNFLTQASALNHVVKKHTPESFYQSYVQTNKIKEVFYKFGGFFNVGQRQSKWTGFELVHEATLIGKETAGRSLKPYGNFDQRIIGLTKFNELYRKPMQKVAQQPSVKKVMLHPILYKFILDQS